MALADVPHLNDLRTKESSCELPLPNNSIFSNLQVCCDKCSRQQGLETVAYGAELLMRSPESWEGWEWLSQWSVWLVHWGHFHDELARGRFCQFWFGQRVGRFQCCIYPESSSFWSPKD